MERKRRSAHLVRFVVLVTLILLASTVALLRETRAMSDAPALVNWLLAPAELQTGAGCRTTSAASGSYSVNVCITQPLNNTILAGIVPITATVNVTGSSPGISKLIFYLDGQYLITDYKTPYTFELPSGYFIDATRTLSVKANMRDGLVTNPPSVSLVFRNGVTEQPVNPNRFTPYIPPAPAAGQPLLVAATGDGASGEWPQVTDMIASWNPQMFLYLADVYDKGTYTEFFNWYGTSSRYFGRFRNITNPSVGNHEYLTPGAAGYFYYWNNIPSYYSYNAGGWHFVALNSTSEFNQRSPGTAQYEWLAQDLAANTAACTLVYYHHPRFSIGDHGDNTSMTDLWQLMAQRGVDIVLSGHDHDYQRWRALDGSGNPSATGITQFVVGVGGHGVRPHVRSDSRVVVGFDTSPDSLGALRLELNPTGAAFRFINMYGTVLDSGTIGCTGAPADSTAPTTPTNLTSSNNASGYVVLNWTASSDNTGVAGYGIYRDGVRIATTGTTPSYTDNSVQLNRSYTYRVDAYDAAGNRSAQSNATTITTSANGNLTLNVTDDAYVNASAPGTNYGTSTTLRTDGSPVVRSYLRFNLGTLPGAVSRATLRVFANSGSTDGYTVHPVTNNTWTETGITYSNAPSVGSSGGTSGGVNAGAWTTVDVTSLVAGKSGALNLALQTSGATSISLSSDEGTNRPLLVIQIGSSTPPPTSTPAPTIVPVTPLPGTFLTLRPAADSYVYETQPTTNFGTNAALRTDASPNQHSYLRFDLSGLSGGVSRATLRIFANSASNEGYTVHRVGDNAWSETAITYTNRPPMSGAAANSGPISAGMWASVDVTALVSLGTPLSLAIQGTSSTAISYSSREGANPPQLVIEVGSSVVPPTSTPTIPPAPTLPPTPLPAGTLTARPVADSYVNETEPGINFGANAALRTDMSPNQHSYLRFDLSGLSGTVTRATLRVFANSASNAGYTVHRVGDNAWSETGITYTNRPAMSGATGNSGPISAGTWASVDVTALVSLGTPLSLAIQGTSGTAVSYSSREGANPPQLVIETSGLAASAITLPIDPLLLTPMPTNVITPTEVPVVPPTDAPAEATAVPPTQMPPATPTVEPTVAGPLPEPPTATPVAVEPSPAPESTVVPTPG